jgi:hypothetical protein
LNLASDDSNWPSRRFTPPRYVDRYRSGADMTTVD